MSQAKKSDTVKVHYTGKLDDGTIFDSSAEGDPLEFTIGEGQVIPGFEDAVVGMETSESKTIKVPSDQAYGPHHEDMVVKIDRDRFPDNLDPQVGQQLQIPQPDGRKIFVTVTEIDESNVTLDANHPLAGRDLTFDIELVEIV